MSNLSDLLSKISSGNYPHVTRPKIVCKDGFTLSVQGGLYYRSSQDDDLNWLTLEVGFPSQKIEKLMPYIEDQCTPTNTVYNYVPVELVEEIIQDHFGAESNDMIWWKN